MRTVVVFSRKGGAGKTTLVVGIGVVASERSRVALIDADAQGSLSAWAQRRDAELPFVAKTTLRGLPAVIEAAEADAYDLAFIDTPGSLGVAEVKALALAALVLVPARPSALDLAATIASVELAQAEGRRVVVALCQVRQHFLATEAAEMRAVLAPLVPVLTAEIGERVAHPNAISLGLGPTENEPHSTAAHELRALYQELRRHLR